MKKLTKAKKRRLVRMLMLLVSVVVLVLTVSGILAKMYSFISGSDSSESGDMDYSDYSVTKPDIEQMLLTKNINSRSGIRLKQVNGIVIHYTANPGTDAVANRDYFESRKDEADESENKVSSHFIIGLDGTIIQCIPLNEIAYASNDRNSDTISIECCHPDSSGKFSDATYNALVKLAGWLCCKYQLNKSDIIRHYDVSGKLCPLYYVRHKKAWITLKNDIWNYFLSNKIN